MWIEGWSVDDFGHLHHVGTEGLRPGLNVVVGPNESGKTTMLHFLRWVLFGFPHGATSEVKRYKPPSGDFGGRVMIGRRTDRWSLGDASAKGPGALVVERHFGEATPGVFATDGSAVPGSLWGELVGSTGRELFETVFAIGTDELTGFDDLDTDEVREHIYAAGIVGRGRSARQVLDELAMMRTDLLSTRKGRIRDLHRELTEGTAALAAAIAEARSLPARRADLDTLDAEVREADRERARLRDQQEMFDRLIETWDDWVAVRAARDRLEELPPAVALPPEPTSALQRALDALDDSERRHRELETLVQRDEARLRGVQRHEARPVGTDPDDARGALSCEGPDRSPPQVDQHGATASTLSAPLEHQRTLVDQRIRELGAGWTRDSVAAIDTSLTTLGAAGDHAKALRSAELACETAVRELDHARADHDRASTASTEARARYLDARSALGALADPDAARDAALELEDLLTELMRQETVSSGDARLRELTAQLAERSGGAAVPSVVLPALLIGAVLCGIGALAGFLADSPLTTGALALTAVGLAVLAWVVARERGSSRPADPPPDRAPGEPHRPRPAGPRDPGAEAPLGSPLPPDDLATLRDRVAHRARIAGLGPRPTPSQVRDRLDALNHLHACDRALASAERDLETQRSLMEAAEAAHRSAQEDLDHANAAWRTWRADRGLGEELRTEDTAGFLDRVRSINELGEQIRVAEAALRADLAQHQAELDDAASERSGAEAGLAALLDGVGASGPADYRRIVEIEQERAAHLSRIEDFELTLSGRFGDTAIDEAHERLATGDLADWQQRADELRSAVTLAAQCHDEAVRTHQDASVAMEQLETSADVPTAALAVESVRSELNAAIEQWMVATLVHRAIGDTLRRFETERQPEVVRRAAESFSRVTAGRYTAVIPEDGSLEVLTRDGRRLDASALSRGTTEQLYLCMRFGLALSHADHTPLPVILDHVLVNADPQRRKGLATELHKVAERLQVLLFTCHPATAELLCARGGPTTVIEMNGTRDEPARWVTADGPTRAPLR